MRQVFAVARSKVVSTYNFHRHILPELEASGPRWGVFQVYLTLSLFLIALYFAFRHRAGDPMTVGDWFGYVFLGLGGLLLAYTFWLAYKYIKAGSFDNAATKDDITQLSDTLGGKLDGLADAIRELVAEIRQDRNERNNKS